MLFRRDKHTKSLTIANGANLSDAFEFLPYSMLVVHMPAAWTAASIGFKVSSDESGTYLPLYDDDGNLVQIDSPSASQAYVAPAELAPTFWIKLWSQNGSGTNANQGAERTIIIDLKA
jgi:hypothetical protein